jgi:hypothetical protein
MVVDYRDVMRRIHASATAVEIQRMSVAFVGTPSQRKSAVLSTLDHIALTG